MKAWTAVTRYAAWVGGAALIVLMSVTVIDIAGRLPPPSSGRWPC